MSLLDRKRIAVGLLSLLILIGAGLMGSRILVLSAARRVFDHWTAAGFPGEPPHGDGPFADMGWPPRIRWSNLGWGGDGSLRLSCTGLEVTISPLSLVRGRLIPSRVEIQNLCVAGTKAISRWSDPVIQSLSDSSSAELPEGGPEAVRFRIAPVAFDSSSVRLSQIDGWIRVSRRAGCELAAMVSRKGRSGWTVVRGEGSWSIGTSEITLSADLGKDRLLYAHARRPSGGGWLFQASGRDDGSLVSSFLGRRLVRVPGVRGIVDFTISRGPLGEVEGEADMRGLRLRSLLGNEGGEVTLDGRVCLSKGMLSLQGVDVLSGDSRVRVEADVPLVLSDSLSGRCSLTGRWEGSEIRLGGSIRRTEDRVSLSARHIDLGRGRTGAADLSWVLSGRRSPSIQMEGRIRIGSGTVAIVGGNGSEEEPLLLRGGAIPISDLEPWLPFRGPGSWSGELDALATMRFAHEGWSWEGTASLRECRIRDIPIPEDIRSLWGGASQGLRFERISTRWSYSHGCLLADSLQLDARAFRASGTVVYSPPDSIFGVLQLSSEEGSRLDSFFRLMGGDSALLDLGISGSAESPTLVLLDPITRSRWGARLEMLRRSSGGAQTLPANRGSG